MLEGTALYISDAYCNCIRKLTLSMGILSTIAGSSTNYGFSGDGGDATSASIQSPTGIALDSSGSPYYNYGLLVDCIFTLIEYRQRVHR